MILNRTTHQIYTSRRNKIQNVTKPHITFHNYQGVVNQNGWMNFRENALFSRFQKMQMGRNLFQNIKQVIYIPLVII